MNKKDFERSPMSIKSSKSTSINGYDQPLVLHKGDKEYKLDYLELIDNGTISDEEIKRCEKEDRDWHNKMQKNLNKLHVMKNPYPRYPNSIFSDKITYEVMYIICVVAMGVCLGLLARVVSLLQ